MSSILFALSRRLMLLAVATFVGQLTLAAPPKIERAIVFLIDGLHWEAPERLAMPNFNALAKQGIYCQKSYMIAPHHPTVGEYGAMHTSSFPNPVLQSGTLFVRADNKFLQEMFPPEQFTTFVANTPAYRSVSRGFDYCAMDHTLDDDAVVDIAIGHIKERDPAYFRIHLQTAGNEGRYLSYTTPDKPYYRNIFGAGSPYVATVENADKLLGKLVAALKEQGKWETTLLIASSDQGQSRIGWHPVADEESAIAPLVIVGPGIPKGQRVKYIEHTDLSPTLAALMGIEPPAIDGGAGLPLFEPSGDGYRLRSEIKPNLKTINAQMNEYNRLRARLVLAADENVYFSSFLTFIENELLTPEPFFHLDRFTEWYKAGTTAHLIEINDKILAQMKAELAGESKQFGTRETVEQQEE